MHVEQILVLSDAEDDLEKGAQFYDSQCSGVGEYFRDSVISDIESLRIYAGVHALQFGFYRVTAKRFPYSIYYELDDATVYIIAILPEKRSPDWIHHELDNRD